MKASDICVGDWLNIYTFPNDNPKEDDLFPAKVSAVSVFDPFKDPDDVTVELAIPNINGLASRPLGTCLPIKLTEEILVKNGFRYTANVIGRHNCKCYELEQKGVYHMTISIYKNTITCELDKVDALYMNVVTNYVHELQHLLRLCGVEKEIEL